MKRNSLRFETRIILTALGAWAPVAIAALLLAFTTHSTSHARWTTIFFIVVAALVSTWILHDLVVYPLRSLTNVLSALREENYSLRARGARRDDALGELVIEINGLASMMESRKLEALEAAALLRAVLGEIDAAIFAFDDAGRLQLANRAAERLVAAPLERIRSLTAADLDLDSLIDDDAPATIDRAFPGASGRWSIRRSTFREKGMPHRLLVIADITRPLREEETRAWQAIVRVLGHELHNSLAPIKSIAGSIDALVRRDPLPGDWKEDVVRGARVIADRADALTRFTRAYAELARLPTPSNRPFRFRELVQRVVDLERRVPIAIVGGPDIELVGDDAQIEQMLINLIKNAAEASMETAGGIQIAWSEGRNRSITIRIEDEGRGLSSTSNLFVPFFTTKANGTGVGLVLSRQIAEAHGGRLTLENRAETPGAIATVTLPRR